MKLCFVVAVCLLASPFLVVSLPSLQDDDVPFYNITVIAEEAVGGGADFDVINVNIYNLNGGLKKNYTGLIIKEQPIYDLQQGAVGNLPWIEFVRFEDDEIEDIQSGAFHNVPSLKTLTITGNPLLRNITEGVFDCSNLRELYLYDNSIAFINSYAFVGLPQLRVLGLDSNNLKRINYKWFVATKHIFIVFLNHNKLSKIREKDLTSLQGIVLNGLKLHFSHNKIRRLERRIFRGMVIDDLNLSHNNLRTLDGDIFEDVGKLGYVDLTGNNIVCRDEQQLVSLFYAAENVTKSDGWDPSCMPGILQ